jgi:hypothetical protein
MTTETVKARRSAPLKTPNPLSDKKVRELSGVDRGHVKAGYARYSAKSRSTLQR